MLMFKFIDCSARYQVEALVPRTEALGTLGLYTDPAAAHSLEIYVREVRAHSTLSAPLPPS